MSEPQDPVSAATGSHLVALLARGVGTYRRAVRGRLERSGFDDVPRSGSWLLTSLSEAPATVGELASRLGTTKQGLSRLSDALVERGYLRRASDPGDHRLVRLSLTPRGRAAARSIVAAVAEVDEAVEERAGPGGRARAELALAAAFGPRDELRPRATPRAPAAPAASRRRIGSRRNTRGRPDRSVPD
ncbi:MAG TPA: MarR family transcriptional regulator [Candidatus Dormibacteraeota bacterium]|nr:MarR family transcriptional regulator [Candidatus Dormibacteraeota bacterium]